MKQRTAKREHYRRALRHITAAKRELVEALNVARPEGLKFTATVEKVIGSVESLEQKFTKESDE
jgi:hypothetical protein